MTKGHPLAAEYFTDFCGAYGPRHTPRPGDRQETERFHRFTREELAGRDDNLDIFWLKDEGLEDAGALPEPEDLLGEAAERLQTALDAVGELERPLGNGGVIRDE